MDTEDANDEKKSKGIGWYSVIYELAGRDILKINEVVKINHIEVFNFLTINKITIEEEQRHIKNEYKKLQTNNR